MKQLSLLILCCLCTLFSFAQPAQQQEGGVPTATPSVKTKPAKLTYRIIPAPANTWGYDIYSNGKMLVHQPNVPAVEGKKGFTTKAAAATIARLVIRKIRKGEMPPTVTVEEMKKAKAI